MTFLLDTHIVLWWLSDSPELKTHIRSIIEDSENRILISVASCWEINIKRSIGKIEVDDSYANILVNDGFELLDIRLKDTMEVLELPLIHRDPFDRIIIAQSITEEATLITRDRSIVKYPIKILGA